ncbi:serine/threonine-protein kinase [Frigoriglobus tundricola]|uniref:Protein kinase domain-containing protein n=1 Tax=Frigoriglobus tundricola TaxID=2774151 RepID=A0A6M5YPJ7_9BACT|nr:serine/threonine-protein kinase [Frigoriglobus tundricola]QJW94892.1 hypothetical protein FTUN_2418 [Frigoriglobus tundricola]
MAAVLKARDLELGRIVALKILPPEAARDPESVNRFKQEGRAAAKLDHDNVARVYFCGEDQGLHFIAFEFVEGDNLRVLIDRRGPLTAAECVPYMMQVAAGLNHAAERGVVHRDIKPSNILITPDGRAKIVDMGLARYLDSDAVNGGVTQSGVTLGTFDYISPEQALDPRRADVRSDIYSLGCTFYHALTGRPPVPEGTAARKLRAHQNEPPLDPRELNPAVPDELAAVLAHMMAKAPADRYQTPTELIAHLKGLAERLRLGADPLANDSATKAVPAETRLLPQEPRVRPWWVLAVAAVALAAVAFVVATSNPGPAPGVFGGADLAKEKAPDVPLPSEKGVGPPVGLKPPTGPVTTVPALVDRLEDPNATGRVRVELGPGKFDLTKLPRSVSFKGRSLELVGAPGGGTRVVLAADQNRDAPGSLVLKATDETKSLTLRNIWFDLTLTRNVTEEVPPRTELFGLQLDAAQVSLDDCVFSTSDRNLDSYSPRSVAVTRSTAGPLRLDVLRCLFAPGSGVGVTVPTGAKVYVTDSGFAPHEAGIHIESPLIAGADPRAQTTDVQLEHSSFMLDPGECAVETDAPAATSVTTADCLFAPVGGPPVLPTFPTTSAAISRGVVVRVRGARPDGVEVKPRSGRTNAFYNVDLLGTRDDTIEAGDKGFVALKQRPWAIGDTLAAARDPESPWKAFRLKVAGPEVDGALLTVDKKPEPLGAAFYQPDNKRRLTYEGMDGFTWGGIARPKPAAEVRQKVWYPKPPPGTEALPGVYANLGALLDQLRPGEDVLIRHDGELPCDTIKLRSQAKPNEGEFRVTFRPYPGCQPVLTVHKDSELDQTLFKLLGGEVTFENVHFRLAPDQPKERQTVTAVALLGGKGCAFNSCVFTLAEEDEAKVAAVHLPDVEKAMVMKADTRVVPKVTFTNCLVRGRGRGVWVGASRPVTLEMTNTLTALDGPVFFAEAGGEAVAGTSTAKFTRVTVLAGGPVVEMHGKSAEARSSGLVKLDVETSRCLFVAVKDAGLPLVELDGVEPTDWKTVLGWQIKEGEGNRYVNFDPSADLAVIRPGGDGLEKRWTRTDWVANIGEPTNADKRFGTITFAAPVPLLKGLAAVRPADVVAREFLFQDLEDAKTLDAGVDQQEWKKKPLPLANLTKPKP